MERQRLDLATPTGKFLFGGTVLTRLILLGLPVVIYLSSSPVPVWAVVVLVLIGALQLWWAYRDLSQIRQGKMGWEDIQP